MRGFTRRACRSIAVAVALAALLTGQTIAASWDAPIALTASGNAGHAGLVTLGASTAVAVYSNNGRIVTRRSVDSGASWKPGVRIASSGMHPGISGLAGNVDVVWESNGRIRYARSLNSGSSFGSSVALSAAGAYVGNPAVGRGPGGVVAVAWQEAKKVPCCDAPWPIRVRVSTNGGATFGPARTLAFGWDPAVAVGKGVVFVGANSPESVWVHRSRDGGATWMASGEFSLNSYNGGGLSITAAGSVAYVAYGDYDPLDDGPYSTTWIRLNKTTDRGKTWTAGRNLTPTTPGASAGGPVISLQGGVLRLAFGRSGIVVYRERPNGGAWTADQQVSPGTQIDESAAGVGLATRVIVLYATWGDGTDVFARSGTP
jgi:hypothetical protein